MTEEFTAHGIYLMAVEEFGPIVEEGEVIRNAFDLVNALNLAPLMVIDGIDHDVVEEFMALDIPEAWAAEFLERYT